MFWTGFLKFRYQVSLALAQTPAPDQSFNDHLAMTVELKLVVSYQSLQTTSQANQTIYKKETLESLYWSVIHDMTCKGSESTCLLLLSS